MRLSRHATTWVLAVTAASLLASCGEAGSSVTADDLEDQTYVATSVEGHDLVADSTLRLVFEGKNLAVSAGCNTLTSAWQLKDDILSWTGEPAQTMMACEPAQMDQDTWLAELFTEGLIATGSDTSDLMLKAGDVQIELDEE